MHVKFGLKLVLKCWHWEILENIRLIFLCEMVSEIWLVLFENLVIPNLELQYRGVPYILKKNYHNSETIFNIHCVAILFDPHFPHFQSKWIWERTTQTRKKNETSFCSPRCWLQNMSSTAILLYQGLSHDISPKKYTF